MPTLILQSFASAEDQIDSNECGEELFVKIFELKTTNSNGLHRDFPFTQAHAKSLRTRNSFPY